VIWTVGHLADVSEPIKTLLGATEVEAMLVSLSSLCSTEPQRLDRLTSCEVCTTTAPARPPLEVVHDIVNMIHSQVLFGLGMRL
jgi:hypothetical protein